MVLHLLTGPLKPALGWNRYRDVIPVHTSRLADDIATAPSKLTCIIDIGFVSRYWFSISARCTLSFPTPTCNTHTHRVGQSELSVVCPGHHHKTQNVTSCVSITYTHAEKLAPKVCTQLVTQPPIYPLPGTKQYISRREVRFPLRLTRRLALFQTHDGYCH